MRADSCAAASAADDAAALATAAAAAAAERDRISVLIDCYLEQASPSITLHFNSATKTGCYLITGAERKRQMGAWGGGGERGGHFAYLDRQNKRVDKDTKINPPRF